MMLKKHVKWVTGRYCGDLANVCGRSVNSWYLGTTLTWRLADPGAPWLHLSWWWATCHLLQGPFEDAVRYWYEVPAWGHLEVCGAHFRDRCPGSWWQVPVPVSLWLPKQNICPWLCQEDTREGHAHGFCFTYTHLMIINHLPNSYSRHGISIISKQYCLQCQPSKKLSSLWLKKEIAESL